MKKHFMKSANFQFHMEVHSSPIQVTTQFQGLECANVIRLLKLGLQLSSAYERCIAVNDIQVHVTIKASFAVGLKPHKSKRYFMDETFPFSFQTALN